MTNRRVARLRELGWTGKTVTPAPAVSAPAPAPAGLAPAPARLAPAPAPAAPAPAEPLGTPETREDKETRRKARIRELDREAEIARRTAAVAALGLPEALALGPPSALEAPQPPPPPVASYTHITSFFELLEETPSSHPFYAALAEFIRAPDNLRPAALRVLWDNASTHAPARPSQDEANIAAFVAGRKVGLEEGYTAGLNDQASEPESSEATKRRALEAGRNEVRETCQSGTCVGASRERIRWSEHRFSGPCRSGRPTSANMSIQVDNATEVVMQSTPSLHASLPSSPPVLPLPDLPPPSLDLAPKSSWDDDVSAVPLIPMFPLPPQRDISILHSGASHPFSSLRRRSRRFTRPKNIPWHRYIPPSTPPIPNYATKPMQSPLSPFAPAQPISSPSAIDALHDPHQLLKLVQVLQILGWSPPTR